ncbi:MAG TPA: hypothetical protein VMG10_12655 [Gemmataceae bacterium]|nr:hypothetical protein [Gemmataceae bacterium]
MAKKKPKPNPQLAALEQKAEKLQAECERHYRKMRLAFNKLEKARRSLARVNARIDAAIDDTLNEKS